MSVILFKHNAKTKNWKNNKAILPAALQLYTTILEIIPNS